jgi:3-deoxy-7-phosphoheptulonate synthase
MIITFEPDVPESAIAAVIRLAERFEGVAVRKYEFRGASTSITEIHLIGSTRTIPTDAFQGVPGVLKTTRVSVKYRLIGRHSNAETPGFEYHGVRFDERSVKIFAGLCAVDTREHVAALMAALQAAGIETTRMTSRGWARRAFRGSSNWPGATASRWSRWR